MLKHIPNTNTPEINLLHAFNFWLKKCRQQLQNVWIHKFLRIISAGTWTKKKMFEYQHSKAILPKVVYIKPKLCEVAAKRRVLWPNAFEKHYIFYIDEHIKERPWEIFWQGFLVFCNVVFSTHLATEPFFTHHLLTSIWIGGRWSTFCEMLLSRAGPTNYCTGLLVVVFALTQTSLLPQPPLLTCTCPTIIKW